MFTGGFFKEKDVSYKREKIPIWTARGMINCLEALKECDSIT